MGFLKVRGVMWPCLVIIEMFYGTYELEGDAKSDLRHHGGLVRRRRGCGD